MEDCPFLYFISNSQIKSLMPTQIVCHVHGTTPTCWKYRTFAPPLKIPSYASGYGNITNKTFSVVFGVLSKKVYEMQLFKRFS